MMVRLDYAILLVTSLQLQIGSGSIVPIAPPDTSNQPEQREVGGTLGVEVELVDSLSKEKSFQNPDVNPYTIKTRSTIKEPFSKTNFVLPIQSPVDLITSKINGKYLPELKIFEPELPRVKAKFYNSGSTAYVYPVIRREDHKEKPYLEGGPLNKRFIFEQMHFHWGVGDVWGSEHMIDGEGFAAEIHMVHFNSKYKTFDEAAAHDDGLAVLTIFAQIAKEDNPLLEPLHNRLPRIQLPKSKTFLKWDKAMQWSLSALGSNPKYYTYPGSLTTEPYSQNVAFIILPKPITISHSSNPKYYTYPGSLTTEPYSQNVAFIILPKPITISHSQLSAFRHLHEDKRHLIIENKRNIQPLNHRPIFEGLVAPLSTQSGRTKTHSQSGRTENLNQVGRTDNKI